MGKPKIREPDLIVPRSVVTTLRAVMTGVETVVATERPLMRSDADKMRQATTHYRIAQLREQLNRLFDDPTPTPEEQGRILAGVLRACCALPVG